MIKKEILKNQIKKDFDINHARSISSELISKLNPHVKKIDIVGSLSRNHDRVGDLDLVLIPKKSFSGIVQKIGLSGGGDKMIKSEYKGMPVNIWLTDKESYEPTKMHFSVGKHIIRLKGDAKKKGMKLTRYGLMKNDEYVARKAEDIKKILKKEG